MYPFIESIRIEDGVIHNINYHNERLNRTRANFWNSQPIDLSECIYSQAEGVWKCRVVYEDTVKEITYIPYIMREINSLRIVYSESVEYCYKSTDREALNTLYARRGMADDVLIVKNGILTDTSIANIALYDGVEWHTPLHPLLNGTRRAELLDKKAIIEKEICLDQIFTYSQITLFNAMIDFGKIVIPINNRNIVL